MVTKSYYVTDDKLLNTIEACYRLDVTSKRNITIEVSWVIKKDKWLIVINYGS